MCSIDEAPLALEIKELMNDIGIDGEGSVRIGDFGVRIGDFGQSESLNFSSQLNARHFCVSFGPGAIGMSFDQDAAGELSVTLVEPGGERKIY
jgi:hypothetical protein